MNRRLSVSLSSNVVFYLVINPSVLSISGISMKAPLVFELSVVGSIGPFLVNAIDQRLLDLSWYFM